MSVAPLASVASAAVAPARFNAAAVRNAEPAAQRAAVAQQFEAILVRQLLGKSMTSLLGGAEGGVAGSVYGDMLTDTLAQQLTAGRGLGLGQLIERQLAPRGEGAASHSSPTNSAPAADPAQ